MTLYFGELEKQKKKIQYYFLENLKAFQKRKTYFKKLRTSKER